MKNAVPHALLGIVLVLSVPSLSGAQNSPNIFDPFAILTYKDSAGSCNPQRQDSGPTNTPGCCASPGRRNCTGTANGFALPACLTPEAVTQIDPYGTAALCTLPATTVDPILPTLGQSGTDMTFYVTSDLHFFRRTYNLTDQLTHVKVLNNFAATGAVWPSGAGIPPNTQVEKPLAVVIDGDFTTHGLPEDLGAFRINYERGTLPASLQYPILVGLGNHETISDETPEDAKRAFDYVQARMANTHIDTQSGNFSWDWQGVHMVQLGTWAGDQTSFYIHASDGLSWLAHDLQTYVGNTTKPVMLFEHYPVQTIPADADALDATGAKTGQGYESFWKIVNKYNVVAMFSGHIHCVGTYSSMLSSLPLQQTLYPSVTGYGRPMDDFLDGSGGDTGDGGTNRAGLGNGCSATKINGKSVPQTAVASFLVTHVNAHYVDVAAVSWTGDGSAPYFDTAEGLPTGAAACRKRINSQFIVVPGLANVTATSTGYSVTAPAGTPEGIPIALKFGSRSGMGGFSFVDSCSDSGDSGTNSLYFPVNGESELAAGIAYPVAALRPGTAAVTPQVVLLTPLSGATPASFSHIAGVDAMTGDQITVYGPPATGFQVAIQYSGSANGWLKATPSSGTFNAYGVAVLGLQYTTPTGGYSASTATVTVTATATGVVQSVSVAVSQPGITLTLNPTTTYAGGQVEFRGSVTPAVAGTSVTFSSGATVLGSAKTLATGLASTDWTASTIGAYSIQASIAGSSAMSALQTLTVVPPFSVAVTPGTIQIAPGTSARITLSATGVAGYTGTATVTCTVPVTYMTCTPASPTMGVSGSIPVTISVAATTGEARTLEGVMWSLTGPMGLAAAWMMRRRRKFAVALLALPLMLNLAGCGAGRIYNGNVSGKAPTGAQTVVINVSSGATQLISTVTVSF